MNVRATPAQKQSTAHIRLHFAAAIHQHSSSLTAAQQQHNSSVATAQRQHSSTFTTPLQHRERLSSVHQPNDIQTLKRKKQKNKQPGSLSIVRTAIQVHHSDRGTQGCSSEYVWLSKQNNVMISMNENGDPYENALAERMNRTPKEEFGPGRRLPSKQKGFQLVDEAIYLYNNIRPHLSLKMKHHKPYIYKKSRHPGAPGLS
ncbi:MAG: hypothetical protein EOP56_02540 [Sphingobacteriales bacterium]|nr:MAG: hypothetical protein EOP56_02540 [Sphingobacteriales bacterium]